MNYTCHSETGKIKSLFLKKVQQAFISEIHIEQYWKELNYLGKPDFPVARQEYASFQSVLAQTGTE